MAQQSGYMNSAPPPIPGGYGNPTGANPGLPTVNMAGIPPAYGGVPLTSTPTNNLPQGLTTPGANPFPANTGGNNPTDFSKLSSGNMGGLLDPKNEHYARVAFSQAYGKGIGDMLYNMLSKGLFNPDVANALINAMQPMRARGANDVMNAFGGEGARFSSAAAIGLGDFESQFALNEQSTLAQLFQHDQDLQVQLLENMLPTLHTEEANRNKGGMWSKILGGLETAAGVAMEFIPGMQIPGAGLISGGVGTMAGGSGSSSSKAGMDGAGLAALIQKIQGSKNNSSAPADFSGFELSLPGMSGISDGSGSLSDMMRENSAAKSITGSDSGSDSNDQLMQLLQLLQMKG